MLKRLCFLLAFLCCSTLMAKEIALTFDDIPMPKGRIFSREERINVFIEKLASRNIQAAFFCVGSYIQEKEGTICIDKLAKESQLLANHSMHHRSFSTMTLEEISDDIDQTQKIIAHYPSAKKWFRFPYLDFGNREERGGTDAKKEAIFALLRNKGYLHGFVTINTFDWQLDKRLQDALREGKKVHYDRLLKVYLELLSEWIHDQGIVWKNVVKREIPHVLLLHGNDINALFLNEIVTFLKKDGWTIISPSIAFHDPFLSQGPLGDLHVQRLGKPYVCPASLSVFHVNEELERAHVFEEGI